MQYYKIEYRNGSFDIGVFDIGDVKSNSTDWTKPRWRMENVLLYIHYDKNSNEVVQLNKVNLEKSCLFDNVIGHKPISVFDISKDEFDRIFDELKRTTFVRIVHPLPKDYDICGVSTPEKIVYVPSRGKEYDIKEVWVEMYFGPASGSAQVPIQQAVARKEIIVEPIKNIGDFEMIIDESTLCTTIYKLKWRNSSLEDLLRS